ncbi:hypothetical protein jhhlp_008338 [Lomentospora prolificans]|uniref:Aspartic peptidase DDI1-type domain-containing protein n=1 Tax=Lomentospora prolificans TaxID=41688 RepID=A0A2N3MXS2_9PEZI|nr:hypothetical protein jhhlp_008338 [Lomentospora prolificans]
MSISEAYTAYERIANALFTFHRQRDTFFGKMAEKMAKSSSLKFDADTLVRSVEDVLDRAQQRRDSRIIGHRDAAVKVFVTAAAKQAAGLQQHRIRTYRHGGEFQPELTVAQACHAALAASGLVGPCSVATAGFSYIEGVPAWNNPVQEAMDEVQALWPGFPVKSILSLGTGIPGAAVLKAFPKPVGRVVVDFAVEAAAAARIFEREHSELEISGRYTRFSIAHGLDGSELSGGMPHQAIEARTKEYLDAQKAAVKRYVQMVTGIYEFSPPAGPPASEPVVDFGQAMDIASPPYLEPEEELESYASVMGDKEGEVDEKKPTWPDEKKTWRNEKMEETSELNEKALLDEKQELLRADEGGPSEKVLGKSNMVGSMDEKKRTPKKSMLLMSENGLAWLEQNGSLKALHPQSHQVLIDATRAGHLDVAKALLDAGVPIDCQDKFGRTPLQVAVLAGKANLVEFFLALGSDVSIIDDFGDTTLLMAAKNQQVEFCTKLLDAGADPNYRDDMWWAPVDWASFLGNEPLVVLLAPRTNLACADTGGQSALGWARLRKADAAAKILEEEIAKQTKESPETRKTEERPSLASMENGSAIETPVIIGNCAYKAWLSTATERTMMSIRTAQQTGLDYLIDQRWAGNVKGISSEKIHGRVHDFELGLGTKTYHISAAVMDYSGFDILLGMDFCRKWAARIDTCALRMDLHDGNSVQFYDMLIGRRTGNGKRRAYV